MGLGSLPKSAQLMVEARIMGPCRSIETVRTCPGGGRNATAITAIRLRENDASHRSMRRGLPYILITVTT